MPRPHLVLPMSMEEFEHMEHRLGWRHEYWGGAARLSTQETAVVSFQRPVGAAGVFGPPLREGEQLRPLRAEDEPGLAELFILAFDDAVEFAGWLDEVYRQEARDNLAWHEKNGFQEIPNYFAAVHRWRHFARLADHFEHMRQPDQACEMRRIAQHWKAIVQELEQSDERWSSGILD